MQHIFTNIKGPINNKDKNIKILNKNVNITNPVNIKLLNTNIENTKPPIKRLNIIIAKLETPNTDAS